MIDEAGNRYGKLTVIQVSGKSDHGVSWHCECDCGNQRTVRGLNLRSGKTKSCGCAKGYVGYRHGYKHHSSYHTWRDMMRRCYNKSASKYPHYGGRGITVCPRWHSVENFVADMGDKPPNMSIDRINNNGNYEPENCRWADHATQSLNRRTTKRVLVDGVELNTSEVTSLYGIPQSTLLAHLKSGWSGTRAAKTPVRRRA